MAILLMVIGLIIYFIFNVIPITKLHYLFAYLGLALALASGIGIMANENNHFGMKVETTKSTKSIKPTAAMGPVKIMIYKRIGTKGPKVYVYNGKKNHTQISSKTFNQIKTGAKTAKLVTTEERYVYKNKIYQGLFGFLDNQNELKKRTNTFELPKSWKVMTKQEAEKLKKQLLKQLALKKKMMQMQAANAGK